jgi:tRNA pseudouridine13 synthase
MKLKQQHEDFQVEEITEVAPSAHGPFALYRMEKHGWTTHDALAAIRRRWKLEPRRLSYGGLKDRHAETVQYLTIAHGPRRHLTHHGVELQYLGQVSRPYTSTDIKANRFRITLRAMTDEEIAGAEQALEEVRRDWVPNYFDDQRFGSVNPGEEFVARLMVLGRYEEALKLALGGSYAFDRAAQKQEKEALHAHWRDWPACKAALPRGHARSLVDYLVSHPDDFRGAVARLRPDLQGLYLSAYQSHLWNRMLAEWIMRMCRPEQVIRVPLRLGELPFHRELDDSQRAELSKLALPLPSARLKIEASDPRAAVIDAVLAEDGLKLADMKLRGLRKPFFSKGERPALCLPRRLEYEVGEDERRPGRKKLLLAFDLPRGSYATLIVKRITHRQAASPVA